MDQIPIPLYFRVITRETGQEALPHSFCMCKIWELAQEACYFKLRTDIAICFLQISDQYCIVTVWE